MPEPSELIIHTDGASRGNPGAAAFAYTIVREDESDIEEAGCLGKMTNNQAEYTALVRALEHAKRLGGKPRVVVHSDSELLVKQMRGEYKVKNPELRDLYEQASELVEDLPGGVTFRHVRREYNKRADQLCNEALDGKRELSAEELIAQHQAAQKKPAQHPTAEKKGSLREDALACLRGAQAQPSAEKVWDELLVLLGKHGVKLPGHQSPERK